MSSEETNEFSNSLSNILLSLKAEGFNFISLYTKAIVDKSYPFLRLITLVGLIFYFFNYFSINGLIIWNLVKYTEAY